MERTNTFSGIYAAAAAHEVGTGLVDCHHDIGLSLSLPLEREQDTVDQAASLEHHLEQLRRRIVEVEDQRGTSAGEWSGEMDQEVGRIADDDCVKGLFLPCSAGAAGAAS